MNITRNEYGVLASADLTSDLAQYGPRKAKKITAAHVNWENYYRLIESDLASYKDDIDSLNETKSLENLEKVVSALSQSFYDAATVNTTPEERRTDGRGAIFDVNQEKCLHRKKKISMTKDGNNSERKL